MTCPRHVGCRMPLSERLAAQAQRAEPPPGAADLLRGGLGPSAGSLSGQGAAPASSSPSPSPSPSSPAPAPAPSSSPSPSPASSPSPGPASPHWRQHYYARTAAAPAGAAPAAGQAGAGQAGAGQAAGSASRRSSYYVAGFGQQGAPQHSGGRGGGRRGSLPAPETLTHGWATPHPLPPTPSTAQAHAEYAGAARDVGGD